MNKEDSIAIAQQRKELFESDNEVRLIAPCGLNSGIISSQDIMQKEAVEAYEAFNGRLSFFIPASGTGSRMFQFLYRYANSGIETPEVKLFFENIKTFALTEKLPLNVKSKIGGTENSSIANYLIGEQGMNYGAKPKGLIPFHKKGGEIFNPFQEQFIQAKALIKNGGEIHFTIQKAFEEEIIHSLERLDAFNADSGEVSFSEQSVETNAYCFDEEKEEIRIDGKCLRRPAGHGALLHNLKKIDSDIVLVKNIDNIQKEELSILSNLYWKIVSGYLVLFMDDLTELGKNFSHEGLKDLNVKYQFLSNEDLESFNEDSLKHILSRPSRVCGMVKNEGAPGGGPFWVDFNGVATKQIVEKSQISDKTHQQDILEASTHFNPVFIALSTKDALGEKVDLSNYVDDSKYLKVKKPHAGEEVYYRELPGLWNGSMADWNTIFIEIPSEVFTPVKTVLDLLD